MMKLYYQDDHATIYHADALDVLNGPFLGETDYVVVTDPPYGVDYVSNFAKSGPSKPIHGDNNIELRDNVLRLFAGSPMLVFGSWTQPKPANTRHVLIWDKGLSPSMGDLSLVWGSSYEEIYVIGEGWTGKRRSNVYNINKLSATCKERPNHPTPKPIPLMRQLIERCPEGVILDPFMGSGSTLRAAKDLNRKSIGIEIDEQYCEIAARRLAQEVLPL
jgi:DNA modification methylase